MSTTAATPSYQRTRAALLKRLKEDGMSQKDFCEKELRGQNQGDFSSWKKGTRPNAALTQRIHDWLQKGKGKKEPKIKQEKEEKVLVKVKKEPKEPTKGGTPRIKKTTEVIMKPSKTAKFGYVYVMKSERRAELKIGCAFDPKERMSNARVWDDSITIAATSPYEDYRAAERYVHALLGNYRELNTEWFSCSLDEARVACRICRKVQDAMKLKRAKVTVGV